MIKCKIDRFKGKRSIKVVGMSDSVMSEIMTLINYIYRHVPPENREPFKNTVIGCVLDPKSPVWEADHGKEK